MKAAIAGIYNNMKRFIRELTPPFLWHALRHAYSWLTYTYKHDIIEWEYMPEGWKTQQKNPTSRGWDVESILDSYKANWPIFVKHLEGTLPLGISPESASKQRTNVMFHNLLMTYGYVLAVVTQHKSSISMLDWGGGIGHYYLISQSLIPEVKIEYHCKDYPRFVEHGKTLLPDAHFHTDVSCLERQYDFVLASSALHYEEDWRARLKSLADAARDYLFVTRLPIIHQSPSFVIVQRPYRYGYNTEYLGWCVNREEFLKHAKTVGLQLIREFVVEQLASVHHAPEQPEHWGFLFRKKSL